MYIQLGPTHPVLTALKTELLNNAVYGYKHDPAGQEKLRQLLRVLHGYNKINVNGNIAIIQPDSLMDKLKRGQDIYIASNHFLSTESTIKNRVSVISAQDTQHRQKRANVYFDSQNITAQEVHTLMRLKAGESLNLDPSVISDLESKASYVVIRAETKQYCLMDSDTTVLREPIARVSYYSCFPNLESRQSKDYLAFADHQGYLKNDGALLKKKFKDILRLNRDVAAQHQEGFDVVTPNAFLHGLERTTEQLKAKRLFAQAVYELAQEDCPPGFLGFFVHEDSDIFEDQLKNYGINRFKTPIMVGHGVDASAPTRACAALKNGRVVAEAVMGHPLHPAGNGALGDRAVYAKEENDDRVMLGDIEWMFSPNLNPRLLERAGYRPISAPNTAVQTTVTSAYGGAGATAPLSSAQKAQLQLKDHWVKNGFSVGTLSVVPDLRKNNSFVLKLDFANPNDADKFVNHIEQLSTKNPPVTLINDRRTVILGQDRMIYYFQRIGMCPHGHGKDMFDALIERQSGSTPTHTLK